MEGKYVQYVRRREEKELISREQNKDGRWSRVSNEGESGEWHRWKMEKERMGDKWNREGEMGEKENREGRRKTGRRSQNIIELLQKSL